MGLRQRMMAKSLKFGSPVVTEEQLSAKNRAKIQQARDEKTTRDQARQDAQGAKFQERFKRTAGIPQSIAAGQDIFKSMEGTDQLSNIAKSGLGEESLAPIRQAQIASAQQAGQGALTDVRSRLASAGIRGGAAGGALAGAAMQGQRAINEANAAVAQQDLAARQAALSGLINTQLGTFDRGADNLSKQVASNFAGVASEMQQIGAEDQKKKVVCTALMEMGHIPKRVWIGDVKYSLAHVSIEENRGYRLWAEPVTRLMQKSNLVTSLVKPFGKAWAEHMAYKMGYLSKPNYLGAVLQGVFRPVCRLLGKVF